MLHRSNGSERPPVGVARLRSFRSLFKMRDVLSTHSAFPHFRLRSWSITATNLSRQLLVATGSIVHSLKYRRHATKGRLAAQV
jgi:hypothetical protein